MSVSIIMPAYNAEKTISEAIDSVINQTFKDWELLIIDDKSFDSTYQIAKNIKKTYKDKNIQVYSLRKNSGSPAHPRNVGIKLSRKRFIAFLDADDIWEYNKLEVQVKYMLTINSVFTCTGYNILDERKRNIGCLIPPTKNNYLGIIRDNTIGCLSVIYDSHKLGKRYFPKCGHEDYALWLDILREGYEIYGIKSLLCTYQRQPQSVSSNKIKVLFYFYNIYNRREKNPPIKSVFLTLRYVWLARTKYKRHCKKS